MWTWVLLYAAGMLAISGQLGDIRSAGVQRSAAAHDSRQSSGLSPETNIHFTGRYCKQCHEGNPTKGRHVRLKFNGDPNLLCRCHVNTQNSYWHPIDIDPPQKGDVKIADDLPLIGMTRHIVIAEDAGEALACGRRAYLPWRHSFYVLWDRHGTKPIGVNLPEAFDELIEEGLAIAGTPDQVRDEIARQVETAGVNYMVCRFAFGDLTYDEARRSADLFATHVLQANL